MGERCEWSPPIKCLQIQGTADSRESQPEAVFLFAKNDPPCRDPPTHKAGDFLRFLPLFIETSSPAVSIIPGSSLAQIPLPQTYTQQN